jgi:uncharacterized protein (TIGR03643 family)
MVRRMTKDVNPGEASRIIEMAWEDRTSFDAIERSTGLSERDVIQLMRSTLGSRAFRRWRARVAGRATKHDSRRSAQVLRHQARTHNKVNR